MLRISMKRSHLMIAWPIGEQCLFVSTTPVLRTIAFEIYGRGLASSIYARLTLGSSSGKGCDGRWSPHLRGWCHTPRRTGIHLLWVPLRSQMQIGESHYQIEGDAS